MHYELVNCTNVICMWIDWKYGNASHDVTMMPTIANQGQVCFDFIEAFLIL